MQLYTGVGERPMDCAIIEFWDKKYGQKALRPLGHKEKPMEAKESQEIPGE